MLVRCIKIHIYRYFYTSDQHEVLKTDFIDIEVKKSINPIIDYDKTRFIPINNLGNIVENVKYKLNFLTGGVINNNTTYGDLTFDNDDIKYRKNRFIKSFLRLSFFDSDSPTNQNLVSFVTIFSRITKADIIGTVNNIGIPFPAFQFPLRFILNNPISKPDGFSEGFYLYHYKSDVLFNLPRELYMRASFNNAKTGKITQLITTPIPQDIESLNSKIYTKYILTRTNSGYYYEMDTTYSSNIDYTIDLDNDSVLDDATINLYEMQVI